MMGMIDLNTTEEDEITPPTSDQSSSTSASALSASNINMCASGSGSVCMELWHACAGTLISLPKRGSLVVYFPQGHLEQLPDLPLSSYDVPPHIFCRVVDVQLHAEEATDEVMLSFPWFLRVSTLSRSWQKKKMRGRVKRRKLKLLSSRHSHHIICFARPSLLLILALMGASLSLVGLLRTASLPWIILNRGLHRNL
uniref:Auxin response factor 3-like n=2 Tax=Rhizophora mucronata TaxID=61149 RepID=A0A2P2MPZ1_RHIMU